MKRLLVVAVLATSVATPAFAQALFEQNEAELERQFLPSSAVISSGRIVGQDPDIGVRHDLLRQSEYYLNHND